MAEETKGVKNTGLLIVAIILALVVAVVYNAHIAHIKETREGKVNYLLEYTRSLEAGDRIDEKDIIAKGLNIPDLSKLGNVVTNEDRSTIIGKTITQSVRVGQFVEWGHTTAGLAQIPDNIISGEDKVAAAVEIDTASSPGAILTPGGRVNLVGMFRVGSSPLKAYTIIENVRVLSVAGGSPRADELGDVRPGRELKSYRTIVVEMDKDVHLQFLNVVSHAVGPVAVEVLNRAMVSPDEGGIINRQLQELAEQAASPTGRGPM